MQVIKKTKKFELNKGSLQADGLYNVSEINGDGLSNWFDKETADKLKKMKAFEFNRYCEELTETN